MSDLTSGFSMRERPDDMVHLRLPAELRAVIERAAEREHRTLSGQIRFLIATGIETQAARQPANA